MTLSLPSLRLCFLAALCAALVLSVQHADAAVYGGGLTITPIGGGISNEVSIRVLILKIIAFILNIVLILAVLAIIVAGVYLIVSGGDETQKDKAKNIILYAVIGILLILLSRVIVVFVNSFL